MSEHERVQGLLSPYLDGRVNRAERALVERHLSSCADCVRSLATLRATVALVREMPRIRAPRSFAVPRSMARRPQATWAFPLLRAATAIAALLFVALVGVDWLTRTTTIRTAAPQMAAPAALPATSIAMQPAAPVAPTSAPPQAAPPSAPAAAAKQSVTTPAPQMPSLAAAPATATLPAGAEAAAPATVVEPPTEQALRDYGLGGGGAPPPGPPPAAPTHTATAEPTPAPTRAPEPTQVARAAEPQSLAAPPRAGVQVERPGFNPMRVAEGALAILAVAFGLAAWIAGKRNR